MAREVVVLALIGLSSAACNAIFGLDEATVRTDAGAAGSSAGGSGGTHSGGNGGTPSGGTGGTPSGGGGTGGTPSGGTGGTPSGGTGGTPSGGTGGTLATTLIGLSESHACAARGTVLKCWGDNSDGELDGVKSTNAVGDAAGEMGSALAATNIGGAEVAGIALGDVHSCVLTKTGGVRCWGAEYGAQLGTGSQTTDVPLGAGAMVKKLDAAGYYSCALLDSGSVKCWGKNDTYQLGTANTNDLGANASEMGDALLPLDFGASSSTIDIATGYDFACARLDAPQVRCWGTHDLGQLGFDPASATPVPLASSSNILVGAQLLAVAAGRWHACVIHADQSMSCWGVNYYGELGLGITDSTRTTPSKVLLGSYQAKAIALGWAHTCAIVEKTGEAPSVKCWGHNDLGQRGVNSKMSAGDTPSDMGDALPSVMLPSGFTPAQIVASGSTTCAASEAGEVLCWGANDLGLLGQGRSDPSIGDTAGSMQTLAPIDLAWP